MWRFQAVRFVLRRVGLLGWVGLMLSISSIAYAVIIAPQQRAELDAATEETSRLQQRRMALEKKSKVSTDSKVPAKAAIELPKVRTTPELLLNLEKVAQNNQLQLNRISYTYSERAKTIPATQPAGKQAPQTPQRAPLVEVRMTVPVSGKYTSIRAFVAQVLENRPTLALDSMSLTRESIGQTDLQAQLRFTSFMRPDE